MKNAVLAGLAEEMNVGGRHKPLTAARERHFNRIVHPADHYLLDVFAVRMPPKDVPGRRGP
ncbi:MAG: hypothetical protein V3R27_04475, partial [Pseudomonadales bacterium]